MDFGAINIQPRPELDARKHTLSPSCSGTSVIGIKFKDGIFLAADSLISYGSLARYTNYDRVVKVHDFICRILR